MSFTKRSLIFLAVAMIGLAPCLMAQKGASRLEGIVKDSTGGVVPGASVVAKNEETGVAREAFTNEAGAYVFPVLAPGNYTVTAELTGFKRVQVEKVKCDVAAVVVQNFTLEVGQLSETVTVTAAGVAPIATTTSDIADTVQGQTIVSLPLNGRNPLELVQLNAGIAGNQAQSEAGSQSSNNTNRAGLGANGARAVNNAVYLDGVDITNSQGGTSGGITTGADILQSVDAIGEFRVISANPTAEFGKNSGMQIEIVTRSGTNDLHGSLYEFHRNTAVNANDFFNNTLGIDKPKLLRNQFGGTVGGPVYIPKLYNGRNKTFFFFNYEGFREAKGTIVERPVLTPTARTGVFRYYTKGPNFTGLVDSATGQVKPEYAGLIGNMDVVALDKSNWDGIGKDTSGVIDRYIKLTSLPNDYGTTCSGCDGLNLATFRFNAPDPETRNSWVMKFDEVFSSKHTASVRVSHGQITRHNSLEPFPGLPTTDREEYQNGTSINLISNLTPTVTNEFRFGFTRNLVQITSNNQPNDILIDCDSTFDCIGTANPDLTTDPSSTARMTYQATDNISWSKGNHLFKGGFTVRTSPLNRQIYSNIINADFNSEPRNQQNATVDLSQLFGTAAIPINGSNDQVQAKNFFNFYLGRMGGSIATYNAASQTAWGPLGSGRLRGFRSREWGFFFQDDWRVSSKLTLNLGVRYELFEVPYEVNSFFVTQTNRKLLDPQIDTTKDYPPLEFGVVGPKYGTSIYPGDHNNFAPTVGFSYDPFGKGKTAIRGAYRVSYDKLFSATIDTIDNNAPGLQNDSVMNGDTLRDTGLFAKLAPGGLNAGKPMTPRLADFQGTSVGGIVLPGSFNFAQFLGTVRSQGGNLPEAPLAKITETRTSGSPYEFARDLRTAYGQTWSVSIQHEIMKGTVLEVRYLGRKGTKEYMGVPASELRMPAAMLAEVQKLQWLLTNNQKWQLGVKPGALPADYAPGKGYTVAQLFGTTSANPASDYSQFKPGVYDAYAYANFPSLYPFFLAGQNSFDTSVQSAVLRNDFVSTCATLDNSTAQHNNSFYTSTPKNAVPSGNGLNPRPPDRVPEVDPRYLFGSMPIIVGVQQNSFRPNLQFLNGPRATINGAHSSYHALQVQVQRRFYQGLQFQANYTWSKNLDITNEGNPAEQGAAAFFERYADYSYSDNDLRHDIKVNAIWDVPIGRDRKWLKSMHPVLENVIGGWQVAGFMEGATDFPMNIAYNGSDRTAPPSTGGVRPSWDPNFSANGDTAKIGQVTKTGNGVFYFQPQDFNGVLTRTLIGKLGNVPRNFWRGPGYFNIDMTLSKFFRIQEERTIEFRAEFFNFLNHANFANPPLSAPQGPYIDLSNLQNPNAGKITTTLGNPRLIQFALKLNF